MEEKTKKKSRRIYYSMGEVAEMFDVNPSLIRYWESRFDILKPDKNRKGNRLFTPADIDNLKLIYYLVKEKGMTLDGAQKRIKDNKDGLNHDIEIIDRLQSIRAMLVEIREELKMSEDDIVIEIDEDEVEMEIVRTSRADSKAESVAMPSETQSDEEDPISFELHMDDDFKPSEQTKEKIEESDSKNIKIAVRDGELPFFDFIPAEVVTQAVNEIVDVESPIEQEYIAELSRELAEEAETASEVMEALSRYDNEEENKRPLAFEQKLF